MFNKNEIKMISKTVVLIKLLFSHTHHYKKKTCYKTNYLRAHKCKKNTTLGTDRVIFL